MSKNLTFKRNVGFDEVDCFSGRDHKEGDVVYKFSGPTYGCVGTGVACTFDERGVLGPFFEMPISIFKELDNFDER